MKKFFFFMSLMTSFIFAYPALVKEELLFTNAPFSSAHASTICETAPGVFLVACFGGTEEQANDVAIWMQKYENGKWAAIKEIARHQDVPCWNPVLFALPSGEVLLFYKVGRAPFSWSGYLKRSYDGGESWTHFEKLPAGILGPAKNKPLLLEDGTLLCGTSWESYKADACWVDVTKDFGKTWQKYGPIALKDCEQGMIQPTLFQINDHTLFMLSRPRQGLRAIVKSISKDKGKSWSDPEVIEIANPDTGSDGVVLKDGKIVYVNNTQTLGRSKLDILVSNDQGNTFTSVFQLENEPGREFSYPAIIQAQNGDIHITYTYNRECIKHVVLNFE
jgi:predicted neuraminidase